MYQNIQKEEQMRRNNFGFAAKTALPLLALITACAHPVFGTPVDFTTTGTFSCGTAVGCSTSNLGSTLSVTNNGNTLTITAVGFTNLNIPPGDTTIDVNGSPLDDANVITFNTTSTNHGAPAGGVDTAGVTFTLNVDQTSPPIAPNTGNFAGSFSGAIDARGSTTIVSFNPALTSLTLGGNITYSLDFLDPAQTFWTIPNPGINKIGVTTETVTVTPEPTFILLTGFGFAGVLLTAHRRRRWLAPEG
jgi:hypothetical protein